MKGTRILFDTLQQYSDKGGIYMIQNTMNGKYYIGSTKHFVNRWTEHSKALRTNKSSSIILQRAYNKYGNKHFRFIPLKVLIDLSPSTLLYEEQLYLDREHPAYNAMPNATTVGRKRTNETIEKQRASLIKSYEELPIDVKRGNMKGIEVTNVITGEVERFRSTLKLKEKYGICYNCLRRILNGQVSKLKKYQVLMFKEF